MSKNLTETSKPGFQPWNHEAFLSDRWVKRMTSLQRKTYATLLHEAFFCSSRPYLPDDEEELEVLADCETTEEWLGIRDAVMGMFDRVEIEGVRVYRSKRVEEDWERMLESRNLRSTRAKRAAEAKHKQAQASTSNDEDARGCQVRVRERVIEEKESEQETIHDEDGQDDMKIKNELQAVCAGFGVKPGGFKNTWDDVNALAKGHSVGAVVTDFTAWMEENQGDDFPRGPVSAYLYVAHDRLAADTAPATAILKDPEVVGLSRELSHVSGGVIAFVDKQRIRIGEVLKEFTAEEITAVFKTWLGDQDLNDAKNVSYLPGKFVQIMDNLCYSLRRSRLEKIKADADREAAKLRLQAEAQAELDAARKIAEDEQNSFDPLAELA